MRRAFNIVITLLVLAGFALLARMLTGGDADGNATQASDAVFTYAKGLRGTVTGLGVVLLGAWLSGKLAQMAALSKITGYLVFGILVGPYVFGLIDQAELGYLKLANDLAIVLIALAAGGEIDLGFVKRSVKMIGAILSAQLVVIMLLVGTAMVVLFRVMPSLGVSASDAMPIALVVTVIATASSPAVVIALIEEVRARGAFTQAVLTVTVCKDLVLVVLFAIAMAFAGGMMGVEAGGGGGSLATHLGQALLGSLAFGAVLGLALAAYAHFVGAHLALTLVGASFGVALLSEQLHLEPLLTALAAGVLMRNVYPAQTKGLFEAVRELSVPVYAVFFAVAGCKTDPAALATVWPAVLTLVVVRGGAVYVGTWAGAKLAGVDATTRTWGWTAFVSQAGVSLALTYLLAADFDARLRPEGLAPDRPTPVFLVLVSAIAIHELVGPLLFKLGLSRSGDAGREGEQEAPAPPEYAPGAQEPDEDAKSGA